MKLPTMWLKRRNRLVARDFQFRVVARLGNILIFNLFIFVGLALFAPVVTGWMSGFFEWGLMQARMRASLALCFALPLLCALVGFFALGLLEIFRIAGPCYRFHRVFESLRQLRIPGKVRLRKDDYLQDLAEELQAALQGIETELRHLRGLSAAAHQTLEQADGCSDQAHVQARELVHQIHRGLLRFQLEEKPNAPAVPPLPSQPIEPQVAQEVPGCDTSPNYS